MAHSLARSLARCFALQYTNDATRVSAEEQEEEEDEEEERHKEQQQPRACGYRGRRRQCCHHRATGQDSVKTAPHYNPQWEREIAAGRRRRRLRRRRRQQQARWGAEAPGRTKAPQRSTESLRSTTTTTTINTRSALEVVGVHTGRRPGGRRARPARGAHSQTRER